MTHRLKIALLFLLAWPLMAQAQMTPQDYIAKYKQMAIAEMKRSGVPASITLAQGMLESANGNSVLATKANNHFGIKCKSTWTGGKVYHDDDAKGECFRSYPSAEESYRDHSDFLRNGQRYASLFELDTTDYKGWANGLKAAGYATNPRYPELLITLIERHSLHLYDIGQEPQLLAEGQQQDGQQAKEHHASQPQTYNRLPVHVANGSESLAQIAEQHKVLRFQLPKNNDLPRDFIPEEGTVLYLKPKNRKADQDIHRVKPGENMYYISQRHAVKLKLLYKRNRMAKGQEPVAGEEIYLNRRRTEAPKTTYANTVYRGVVLKKPGAAPGTQPAAPESQKPATAPVAQAEKTIDQHGREAEFYVIEPGETVFGIARRFGTHQDSVAKWTGRAYEELKAGDRIVVGWKGEIPAPKEEAAPSLYQAPKSVETAPASQATPENDGYHIVEPKQTLYSISRLYGVTVQQLRDWNGIDESNSIKEGQKLRVR